MVTRRVAETAQAEFAERRHTGGHDRHAAPRLRLAVPASHGCRRNGPGRHGAVPGLARDLDGTGVLVDRDFPRSGDAGGVVGGDHPDAELPSRGVLSALGRAAVEGLTVDLAEIVDAQLVAGLGLAGLRLVGPRRIGDAHHLLLDVGIGNLDHRPGDLDAGEILDLDRRNDLVGQRELEIGVAGQDLLGFLLVLGHGDLGLHRGLLAALRNHAAGGIVEDLVDHLGHEGLAVHLAQMLHRHLAGTEAVEPDLVLRIGEPRHQPGFHVLRRNGDLDLSLQAGIKRFGYLHH